MKKLKILILTIIWSVWILNFWYCIDFPYENEVLHNEETEIWITMKEEIKKNENNVLNKLLKVFWLSTQDRYDSWTSKAVYYTKMIVNLVLWFASFIALIMLIYWFYMMFFSREDSGLTRAKQILKWTLIAILLIWLSRFIISMIYRIQSTTWI